MANSGLLQAECLGMHVYLMSLSEKVVIGSHYFGKCKIYIGTYLTDRPESNKISISIYAKLDRQPKSTIYGKYIDT